MILEIFDSSYDDIMIFDIILFFGAKAHGDTGLISIHANLLYFGGLSSIKDG